MITGYLASAGIRAGEKRVDASLQQVDPANHAMWQTRAERQTNPIPYRAEYFGEKLHIDQNEKLVMFGVTMYVP